ncbi:MAG: hypothetical protein CL681_25325 [Blastopirellula sp.]|nr:hypothetical protein [Blastopirellula sp.]
MKTHHYRSVSPTRGVYGLAILAWMMPCFSAAADEAKSTERALTFRATQCQLKARFGNYRKVESARGELIQLATDPSGNAAYAVGDVEFRLPHPIADGAYHVTVRWRTGTMSGTPWAFLLGCDGGAVIAHSTASRWHYFYPGLSGKHSDQWFEHDLAGPNPVDFAVWPNTPIAPSVTIRGAGKGEFYVRLRDMSPARGNSLSIESITLTPVEGPKRNEQAGAQAAAGASEFPLAPVGEDFTIGLYYAMPWLQPKDSFSWDYAFMDMARSGCNFIVVSGNCWADQWAAIKHWDMRGVTSYGELNNYPGPGKWKPEDMLKGINETRERLTNMVWNEEYVGDACVGHIMTDEPECSGLTEDKQNFLRAWADVYHQHNPKRKVYVNHCDPTWYDLHEKHATCSAAPTIAVNSDRIAARVLAARKIGLENFTYVALLGRISDWSGGKARQVEYWNMGTATPAVFKWLALRSNSMDAYEMMTTAYCCGTAGFHPYMYNQHRAVSLVDRYGNGQYGIRQGFSNAAHDIRRSHGWPGVTLRNNGSPFADRGTYSAGDFKLTADAVSDSKTITKVVFGKSVNGGSNWETTEDKTAPYSATFSTKPDETVIFRAQAVDADGKQSIFAANMIHIASE